MLVEQALMTKLHITYSDLVHYLPDYNEVGYSDASWIEQLKSKYTTVQATSQRDVR